MMETTVSNDVLRAARSRGFSAVQIGRALGVSHQRINQRIGGSGKYPGRQKVPLHFVRCNFCGKPTRIKMDQFKRYEKHFCAAKCHGQDDRVVGDAEVRLAIDLRLRGETWKEVVKQVDCSYPCIQLRIWVLLHEKGFLTSDIVHAIWTPSPSIGRETFGVKHLINRSGVNPQDIRKYTALLRWMRS